MTTNTLTHTIAAVARELNMAYEPPAGTMYHTLRPQAAATLPAILIAPSPRDTDRLIIRGSFPYPLHRYIRRNAPACRITVSADRTPQAIAGDITRRLWPTYLATLDEARAAYAAQQHAAEGADELARDLATPIGATLDTANTADTLHRTFTRHFGDSYPLRSIRAHVTEQRVDLDLALDPATARAVITLLAELQTRRTIREEPYRYQPAMSYRDLQRELASAHTMLDRANVPRHSLTDQPWTVERRIAWLARRIAQPTTTSHCSECGLSVQHGCACTW